MYEVQVYKYNRDLDAKKINADGKPNITPPTDAEARRTEENRPGHRRAHRRRSLHAAQKSAHGRTHQAPRPRPHSLHHLRRGRPEKSPLSMTSTHASARSSTAWPPTSAASYQIINELSQAKFLRAILSERQLQEVMTDFWFNHFNIYIGKDSDQWYTTSLRA
jgi:hypothetical protein